jgi:hypothetical protein
MANDDQEKGSIQAYIDSHMSVLDNWVKTIYVYNLSGNVKLRYGWNYRFVDCNITGVDHDEEYNQGEDGDNSINIVRGSLSNSVEFKDSIITIEGCTIDAKYKKDPQIGLVASGCRLSFRELPKELDETGEGRPLIFKSKPPYLSSSEVDMVGVMFKDMDPTMIIMDTCRLTAYGLSSKNIKSGGEIKKSSVYISGFDFKVQKGNLVFSDCSGEINGMSVKMEEEGTAVLINTSNLGLYGCNSEIKKGVNWSFSGSAVKMHTCDSEAKEGTNVTATEGGHLRMQECNMLVLKSGTCLELSKAGTRCTFYKGSATIKETGTCISLDTGPQLIAEQVESILVKEVGVAISSNGGNVYAHKVESIVVGKSGPACQGSGGALFELVDCGTIQGIPKSLVGDDVLYAVRGEKTGISGDIEGKGTFISGLADEGE